MLDRLGHDMGAAMPESMGAIRVIKSEKFQFIAILRLIEHFFGYTIHLDHTKSFGSIFIHFFSYRYGW